LNLLQPQDRRSKNPGDSREAALARRRLATQGHSEATHLALAELVRARPDPRPTSLLDVGCGEGGFLRSLDGLLEMERHGVDISPPSIELASKASPGVLFVVANADRFLPYVDASFDVLTSIDSRSNAAEFDRVLTQRGLILVAVPGPDDLIELRERIQGAKIKKSRTARVNLELTSRFKLTGQAAVRGSRTLDPSAIRDLLTATYRGFRESERAAVQALTPMTVTMSHDILAFERR
jgi:23S rRNA (guanine745-N1)-methyltransferase